MIRHPLLCGKSALFCQALLSSSSSPYDGGAQAPGPGRQCWSIGRRLSQSVAPLAACDIYPLDVEFPRMALQIQPHTTTVGEKESVPLTGLGRQIRFIGFTVFEKFHARSPLPELDHAFYLARGPDTGLSNLIEADSGRGAMNSARGRSCHQIAPKPVHSFFGRRSRRRSKSWRD